MAWEDAIWPGRLWIAERDEVRIAEGFRNLSRVSRRWPVPAQFFECMPRFEVSVLKLARDCPADVREREMKRIAEVLGELLPEAKKAG